MSLNDVMYNIGNRVSGRAKTESNHAGHRLSKGTPTPCAEGSLPPEGRCSGSVCAAWGTDKLLNVCNSFYLLNLLLIF